MTTLRKRVDWQTIALEYIHDRSATYQSLAEKYDVKPRTVKWHAERERWRDERKTHCLKVVDKLSTRAANQALPTLMEINDEMLKRSRELRFMLDSLLKTRNADGQTVMRAGVTPINLRHCITGYAMLNKLDRVALGVSDDRPMPLERNPYDDMSEEELIEELKRVRARSIIQ